MGLTTGHVFSDGDTVTAAKLNAMVNNATISADTVTSSMLSDDVIESRHIADGAITSNHIASGAVSLGIISSETSAPGTIIQSGSGGTWEELSPGTTGMLLTSNGADTALTFGLLGSASLGNTLISGLVEHTDPIVGDLLMVKDTVAGVNKHTTIQGVLNSMTGLGLIDANDIASDDEVMVYDKSTTTAKRMLWSEIQESVLNIPTLEQLNQSTIQDDDDLVVYDTSTGSTKRISKADLSTGGSMLEAQITVTAAGPTANISHTIDTVPASVDSGVVVVYTCDIVGGGVWTGGRFTVTLPDAAFYLIEGVKKLDILIENTSANLFSIQNEDTGTNPVLNYITDSADIGRGKVISCTPFVVGSSHFWTVSIL